MDLAELQRDLAASLAGGAGPPAGVDGPALDRMRRSLAAKRRRVAAELLPRLARALGEGWAPLFAEHARSYHPAGLLFHVDDAWAFAASLGRSSPRPVAAAARDDLLDLRLRWARRPGARAHRIRERRSPVLGWTRLTPRALVFRLPGSAGRCWTWPLPGFSRGRALRAAPILLLTGDGHRRRPLSGQAAGNRSRRNDMAQQDEDRRPGAAVEEREYDPRDDERVDTENEATGLGLGLGPHGMTRDEDVPGTEGWRPEDERASGATGGHGDSLAYGATQGYSRYGETTGLVGYDIGQGKDPQETNTPASEPRPGRPADVHQESGPETSRNEGSLGQHRDDPRGRRG